MKKDMKAQMVLELAEEGDLLQELVVEGMVAPEEKVPVRVGQRMVQQQNRIQSEVLAVGLIISVALVTEDEVVER
jgi:hypothetical protein